MKDRLDVSLISGAQQRCLNRHSLRRKRFRANFRAKTRLETHATLAGTGKPFGLHYCFLVHCEIIDHYCLNLTGNSKFDKQMDIESPTAGFKQMTITLNSNIGPFLNFMSQQLQN